MPQVGDSVGTCVQLVGGFGLGSGHSAFLDALLICFFAIAIRNIDYAGRIELSSYEKVSPYRRQFFHTRGSAQACINAIP